MPKSKKPRYDLAVTDTSGAVILRVENTKHAGRLLQDLLAARGGTVDPTKAAVATTLRRATRRSPMAHSTPAAQRSQRS